MDQVDSKRVLWAGPLTLLASVLAVACIRQAAVGVLHPDPRFDPLNTLQLPIFDTLLFGGMAVFAFFRMCSYDLDPIAAYRSLAWKCLLVSFVPDILLALDHLFGGGWPEAFALMAMHVAVWALCVTMLPALAKRRQPS